MRRALPVLIALFLILLLLGGALVLVRDSPSELGSGPDASEPAVAGERERARDGSPTGTAGRRGRRERRQAGESRSEHGDEPASEHAGGTTDEGGPTTGRDGSGQGTDGGAGPAVPAGPAAAQPMPVAHVQGRAVDADTGAPIADAHVRFAMLEDGLPTNWWGDTTDADGKFEIKFRDRRASKDHQHELIIQAKGYRVWRVGSPSGEIDARIVRKVEPDRPGTVTGVVTREDGTAFVGSLKITGLDEFGEYTAQWVVAGVDGTYRMEGVPPRHWRLWVSTYRDRKPVLVPPGGEATLGFEMRDGTAGGPTERRPVVVTGLPAGAADGAAVTAHVRRSPRPFWRTVSAGGEARLELQPGFWTFVVDWDLDRRVRVDSEVPAGEGTFRVSLDRPASTDDEKRARVAPGQARQR